MRTTLPEAPTGEGVVVVRVQIRQEESRGNDSGCHTRTQDLNLVNF